MKVIIAGSRTITGTVADNLVKQAITASTWENEIQEVIHGAAIGIDSAAHRVSNKRWPVISMPANWNKYGRSAGYLRNVEMAKLADALIAIWDGKSPGTRHMINIAKERGLKIYIHYYLKQPNKI